MQYNKKLGPMLIAQDSKIFAMTVKSSQILYYLAALKPSLSEDKSDTVGTGS